MLAQGHCFTDYLPLMARIMRLGRRCSKRECGRVNGLDASPGHQYYFEVCTLDQKHKGRSQTFTWK
jgi:hypothetical protein